MELVLALRENRMPVSETAFGLVFGSTSRTGDIRTGVERTGYADDDLRMPPRTLPQLAPRSSAPYLERCHGSPNHIAFHILTFLCIPSWKLDVRHVLYNQAGEELSSGIRNRSYS